MFCFIFQKISATFFTRYIQRDYVGELLAHTGCPSVRALVIFKICCFLSVGHICLWPTQDYLFYVSSLEYVLSKQQIWEVVNCVFENVQNLLVILSVLWLLSFIVRVRIFVYKDHMWSVCLLRVIIPVNNNQEDIWQIFFKKLKGFFLQKMQWVSH